MHASVKGFVIIDNTFLLYSNDLYLSYFTVYPFNNILTHSQITHNSIQSMYDPVSNDTNIRIRVARY